MDEKAEKDNPTLWDTAQYWGKRITELETLLSEKDRQLDVDKHEMDFMREIIEEKEKKIDELKRREEDHCESSRHFQREAEVAEVRIKELIDGIEELVAHGVPRYIEAGLRKLTDKKGEKK